MERYASFIGTSNQKDLPLPILAVCRCFIASGDGSYSNERDTISTNSCMLKAMGDL